MKTSQRGIELIKKHEGLRLAAYLCPAGVPTIGYGHTKGVRLGQVISEVEAEQFLRDDLSASEMEVERHNLRINQNQFDALVSFIFNVGAGNFRSSTLLRLAKQNPNNPDIERQFDRWVYANGRVLPGLIKRRNDEAKLYLS